MERTVPITEPCVHEGEARGLDLVRVPREQPYDDGSRVVRPTGQRVCMAQQSEWVRVVRATRGRLVLCDGPVEHSLLLVALREVVVRHPVVGIRRGDLP